MNTDKNDTEHFRIKHQDSPVRLDVFLSHYLQRISRAQLQRHIKEGHVRVNGHSAKASTPVRTGDYLTIDSYPEQKMELHAQKEIEFEEIYVDEHIIVVNKPSGLVVHPGFQNAEGTLVNGLLYRYGDLAPSNDQTRPGIVHRLDRDTSGVMVIARTPHAYSELKRQFKERIVKKIYIAIAHGLIRFDSGIIQKRLQSSGTHYNRMEVNSKGKEAITEYEVVERFGKYSIVRVRLKTGRTHQIRVHLKSIGHPLVCDVLYGRERRIVHREKGCNIEEQVVLNRLALHSRILEFIHPHTSELCHFEAPLDLALKNFVEYLRNKNNNPHIL